MIGEWRLSDLQSALGGELPGGDAVFTGVSTDTRSIKPGNLFLALKGPNFDGHRFIEQALEKGAIAVVVSEEQSADIPQWLVDNTHTALGLIGKLNRQRFDKPVFAVTGSAGKTTVKEMLAAILAQQGEVLATRGNLNNDIGGPLTLMEIEDQHQHAVIELGASAEKEIAYTVNLTLPDVAILTNAMGAHLEGFGSLQGVVRAKGEIFDTLTDNGWAIINRDDPHTDCWLDKTEGQNRLTFGIENDQADVVARNLEISENGCYRFLLVAGEQQAEIQLGVMGKHNVANATAACAAIMAAGLPLQLAVSGLEKFTPVKGRMCPQMGAHGATVIDDSYNANPGAVKAAVDLLASLPGKHLLLLGDMAELGDDAAEQHADVGSYAAQKGTGRLMAVGALSLHAVEAFNAVTGMQGGHFETREQMVDAVRALLEPGMTVLVKGSRSAGMEKVVAGLVEGNH